MRKRMKAQIVSEYSFIWIAFSVLSWSSYLKNDTVFRWMLSHWNTIIIYITLYIIIAALILPNTIFLRLLGLPKSMNAIEMIQVEDIIAFHSDFLECIFHKTGLYSTNVSKMLIRSGWYIFAYTVMWASPGAQVHKVTLTSCVSSIALHNSAPGARRTATQHIIKIY